MRLDAPYSIRPATLEDADALAPRLRLADRREIMASHGDKARQSLVRGVERSDEVLVGVAGDDVICMFGVRRPALLLNEVSPWLLAAKGVERHRAAFLLASRDTVQEWKQRYSRLENWVDARNTLSIRWLRWLGFTIEPAVPYGHFGRPFHRFWMLGDV